MLPSELAGAADWGSRRMPFDLILAAPLISRLKVGVVLIPNPVDVNLARSESVCSVVPLPVVLEVEIITAPGVPVPVPLPPAIVILPPTPLVTFGAPDPLIV